MKKFSDLTEEEATQLAKNSIRGCKSETAIREALTKAGFHGNNASVATVSSGSMFMCTVMVWGPNGEIIHT